MQLKRLKSKNYSMLWCQCTEKYDKKKGEERNHIDFITDKI